jgi:hypothetical protein
VAANMAIGGLTAGVRQWWNGGSLRDGMWRGALGGAGSYAGKRIAAGEGFEAGLVGRVVAATGASVTRNASEGKPSFERLVLPFGPVRLRWRPAESEWVPSLDLVGLGTLAWAYLGGMGASLDLGLSVGSGAPVFRASEPIEARGIKAAGTIVLERSYSNRSLRHERVHLLQYDQAYILWSEPAERKLMAGLGIPDEVARHLDLSLHAGAVAALSRWIDYDDRPWEFEAQTLTPSH